MSQMIGRVLAGFRIEAELGRGGQAVVYRATQLALQRQVALKVVSGQLSADPSFQERFTREGISAASLDHPHVIPVYEAGDADGMAYLAMKFIDGPSLDDLIRAGEGLTPLRGMSILHQIAEALDYANGRGLVHRDIKPANILLGPGDHAYLSDFGLTRAMDSSKLTSSGVWMGTLEYVAPEQIWGSEVTAAADRYALAVVAYETLTGRPIFDKSERTALLYAHIHEDPTPATKHRPDLGFDVDRVLLGGLAKDPTQRPATAVVLIETLTEALRRSAASATPPPANATLIDYPAPVAVSDPRPISYPPPPPSPAVGNPYAVSPGAGTARPVSSPPAATGRPTWLPWAIGGAILALAVIILVVVLSTTGGDTNTVTTFVTQA